MRKVLSLSFLAICVFYGFDQCSKIHPAKYFVKPAKRNPPDAAPLNPSVEPAEVNDPFLDPAHAEIRKRLKDRNEAERQTPSVAESEGLRESRGSGDAGTNPAQSVAVINQPDEPESSGEFRCQGKVHCSQMLSCEEAEFYLWNCPGTKLDGDNDGNPCESMCDN